MEGRKKKSEGFETACLTWRRLTEKFSQQEKRASSFELHAFLGTAAESEGIGTGTEGVRKDGFNGDDNDENYASSENKLQIS